MEKRGASDDRYIFAMRRLLKLMLLLGLLYILDRWSFYICMQEQFSDHPFPSFWSFGELVHVYNCAYVPRHVN
jgi:hypothetical protein